MFDFMGLDTTTARCILMFKFSFPNSEDSTAENW